MNRRRSLNDLLRPYPLARRLSTEFDAEDLAADVAKFGADWWHRHAGPYHDGGWESVSLWSPRGDPFEQRTTGGAFAATPALAKAPSLLATLDHFSCERNRIRLMRLQPGARILRHRDPLHEVDSALVRLHVPILTNEDVIFTVGDLRLRMQPGETWHVDVRFPHAVENRGSTPRVHLVMDLARDAALDELLARGVSVGRGRLTGYFAKHALPRPIRRILHWEN